MALELKLVANEPISYTNSEDIAVLIRANGKKDTFFISDDIDANSWLRISGDEIVIVEPNETIYFMAGYDLILNGMKYNISMGGGSGSSIDDSNFVKKEDIADNLTTDDNTKVLSAKQGKLLKQFIDSINQILTSDDTNLDELQEIVNFIKQNRDDLQNLSISNIAGLENALDSKANASDIVDTFIGLKDTVGSYQGYGGKVVAVKQTEDGLEFVEVSSSDIPEYTADDNGKTLMVDNNGNLVWQELTITTDFKSLTDTEDYTDQANKLVIVNQDGTGLTYIEQPNDCSVINVIPEIQTQLYPSQTLTNDDIVKIIEARIQALSTEANIGIIYKCIDPHFGLKPINQGLVETIYEDTETYHKFWCFTNDGQYALLNRNYNTSYDYIDFFNTDTKEIDFQVILSSDRDKPFAITPNNKRILLSQPYVSGYPTQFADINDDNTLTYLGNAVKKSVIPTKGGITPCGNAFLSNYRGGGSTTCTIRVYEWNETSGADAEQIDIQFDTPQEDGWDYSYFIQIQTGNYQIFRPIISIKYTSTDADGNTIYKNCFYRLYIENDWTISNVEKIFEYVAGTNNNYYKIYSISDDIDNNIIIVKRSDSSTEEYILVKDYDGTYKFYSFSDKLNGYDYYSALNANKSLLIAGRAQGSYYYCSIYKLNLKPSLICMNDKTSEVSDTFDLSTWTSNASKIRYASNIGSNQTEFDIAVADGQILRFISLLDNEEKRSVDCGSNIVSIDSKLDKTIVSLDDRTVKVYDNATADMLYDIDLTEYEELYDIYLTIDEFGTVDGYVLSVRSSDLENPYYCIRRKFDTENIDVNLNENVEATYCLDDKINFLYKLVLNLNNTEGSELTSISIYKYDYNDFTTAIDEGYIEFDGVLYNVTGITINGSNMLLNVYDELSDSNKTLLFCVEDLENLKVTNSELAYGISNDFKWTTNTYNCLVLENGSTLKSVNYK